MGLKSAFSEEEIGSGTIEEPTEPDTGTVYDPATGEMVETKSELQQHAEKVSETKQEEEAFFDDPLLEDKDAGEEVVSTNDKKDTDDDSGEDEGEDENIFDDEVVKRARSAGLTVDEINAFSSQERLELFLDRLDKQEESTTQKPEEKEPEENYDELLETKITEDEFDSVLVEEFKSIRKLVVDALKGMAALKGEHASTAEYVRSARAESVENSVDQAFESISDVYGDTFGNGKTRNLGSKTKEYKARNSVIEEALILKRGYESVGKTPPPLNDLIERSARSLFGAKTSERKVAKKLEKRQGSIIRRSDTKGTVKVDPMAEIRKLSEELDRSLSY